MAIAMEIGRHGSTRTMGRNIRRDEVNAAQLEAFLRGPGYGQMAMVDRVESSAKKANIHGRYLAGLARTQTGIAPSFLFLQHSRQVLRGPTLSP